MDADRRWDVHRLGRSKPGRDEAAIHHTDQGDSEGVYWEALLFTNEVYLIAIPPYRSGDSECSPSNPLTLRHLSGLFLLSPKIGLSTAPLCPGP